ncbi:MAG: Gfo/Idh/MocA family protein [Planctomycetota bacterium]
MAREFKANRRQFLQGTVAATTAAMAVPTFIPASALGADGAVAPSETITLGVIGIGPRCTYVLTPMLAMNDVRCLVIADVQASRRDAGKALVDKAYSNGDCELLGDFRELLDRKDIDAVLIATGDRWHAPASMLAAEAGKDIYSEKPCGLTIDLCQRLDETIKRTGRIFQAGTQRRSVPNFQQAVKLAHDGKLGKIKKLYASIYTPEIITQWLPGEPTPPPDECNWNMWLGIAPWRPYNAQYVKGKWRGHWDFDSGAKLLDWGAHTLDLCQWANQSDDTTPVEYEPQQDKIVCRYANGVELIFDFLLQPFGDRSPHYITRLGTCPVRFVGEEGSVETGDEGEIVVEPASLAAQLPQYERVRGLDVAAHARNFFDGVRTRKPTVCNSTVMRRSHIACHAAAIAWILGRTLKFDPVKEEFVGDPEANLLRSRPERTEWAV